MSTLLLSVTVACSPVTGGGPDPIPEEPEPISLQVSLIGSSQVLLRHRREIRVAAARPSGRVPLDGPVYFRSANPNVLSVDTAGVVLARQAGAGYIIATAAIEGRGYADSVRLEVIDPGFTVHVQPERLGGLMLGVTIQVGLVARGPGGDSIAFPGPARLRTTDPAVMTVNGEAQLTGVAMGSAFLVGEVETAFGTVSDSLRVAVLCSAVGAHADYNRPPEPFRVGASFRLGASLSWCDRQIPLTDELTWFTEDSSVVRIDADALTATATGPGTTYIRAKGRTLGWLNALEVRVTP